MTQIDADKKLSHKKTQEAQKEWRHHPVFCLLRFFVAEFLVFIRVYLRLSAA
jgi:hypothetical protein